jgi:hypothetical protein
MVLYHCDSLHIDLPWLGFLCGIVETYDTAQYKRYDKNCWAYNGNQGQHKDEYASTCTAAITRTIRDTTSLIAPYAGFLKLNSLTKIMGYSRIAQFSGSVGVPGKFNWTMIVPSKQEIADSFFVATFNRNLQR